MPPWLVFPTDSISVLHTETKCDFEEGEGKKMDLNSEEGTGWDRWVHALTDVATDAKEKELPKAAAVTQHTTLPSSTSNATSSTMRLADSAAGGGGQLCFRST